MSKRRLTTAIGLLLACRCAVEVEAANWLQFGYDEAHSGNNTAETGYSTASGNVLIYAHGLLYQMDSAPVYVANVPTSSGTKDLLFASANKTLLALNAADGSILWHREPPGAAIATRGGPAVDPNLEYVYWHGADGQVHKYQIGDGTEVVTNGWPEVSTLKPGVEQSASGLMIASTPTGRFLYSVTSGFYGDGGDYQGHLTTIDLDSGAQQVFNSMCSNMFFHFVEDGTSENDCIVDFSTGGRMGGMWGPAGAVFDAQTNKVYVATGNGLFDANTAGGHEWGDSVLALNPNGTGSGLGMPVDSYTPTNYVYLNDYDVDLGSTSPAILPAPAASKFKHLALQTGKDHCVRLLNLDDLSGQAGPAHVGGELNADACTTAAVGNGGQQPAVWVDPGEGSTWVFVPGQFITAFKLVVDGSGNPALVQMWQSQIAGTSPVVANNELYYVGRNNRPVTFFAVKPTTGELIWSDSSADNALSIGFASPIVADGRLFMTSGSGVVAYRLDGIFRSGFN